jgi:hypothetical protein
MDTPTSTGHDDGYPPSAAHNPSHRSRLRPVTNTTTRQQHRTDPTSRPEPPQCRSDSHSPVAKQRLTTTLGGRPDQLAPTSTGLVTSALMGRPPHFHGNTMRPNGGTQPQVAPLATCKADTNTELYSDVTRHCSPPSGEPPDNSTLWRCRAAAISASSCCAATKTPPDPVARDWLTQKHKR